MTEIIKTVTDLCVGCNKCVRKCPMEMANITYQDDHGDIKVRVDPNKCITCGRCVPVCAHGARYYQDDTDRFFEDLAKGLPISLIVAPSTLTNITEYKRLFTLFRQLGVKHIYDVSLGADICTWGHVRYLQKYDPPSLISQPCPAIVMYCEMYKHDLLQFLSPVQSPMACTSVFMTKYKGVTDHIAAISPCIAKKNEFLNTGLAEYNITFTKMLEYLEDNFPVLPDEETDFDVMNNGLGSLYPMPGGLKENLEFFMGDKIQISKSEGYSVYEKLNSYASTNPELRPKVFDVLNCIEGCNVGPATPRKKNIFEIEKTMDNRRKKIVETREKEYFEELYKGFDEDLKLEDFMRKYDPIETDFPDITERDIQMAFKMLDKYTDEEQSVDCGACGSDTCYGMAKKIALKVNIPMNCMVRSIESAKEEHELNLSALMQFETIWNNVESGIAIIDAETREIVDVNPAAVQLFNGHKEAMLEHRCQDVFCPADKCPILDLGNTVERSERKFVKADGTVIPIIKSVSIVNIGDRSVLLENFTDVSHMKEAEAQKRALAVSEEASQAKSAFLANMSHEIRTPMNAIIGMTNIGINNDGLEKKDYCFSRIDEASKHLLGIINDILDMSKIEAGKFELASYEFCFEETMEHIANMNKFLLEEKKQTFSIKIDEAIPKHLVGDEQRLSQVITNLVANAIKFTPEGGSIEIDSMLAADEDGACTIMISVSDTGIGVSQEQQERLFKSFQQADSKTATIYGGTGLGLSISKNIVELMGGRIWLESELGKGSTFSFTVKFEKVHNENFIAEAFSQDEETEISFKGKKALLVEDIEINREIVYSLLEDTLLEIDSAVNGLEAVEMFAAAPDKYDIILMDIQMPEMDGLEATRRIRAMDFPKAATVPIITMTASVFKEDIEQCLKAGMNDHLGKPLDFDEVMKKLQQYLNT